MERFLRRDRNVKPQTIYLSNPISPNPYTIYAPYLSNHVYKVWALYIQNHGLSIGS